MRDLCEVLKRWNCDVEGALARFLDDKELYEEFVGTVSNDESFSLLKKSIKEKNYEEAFEHAHTMKGVTGNLGITPLYQVICALVEELRAKRYTDIEQYYVAVEEKKEEFTKLVQAE